MFRKTDLSIFQKERHQKQPKLNIFKQYDETKQVSVEEMSIKSRLRERFPRLFGSKKNNKITPKIDVEYVPTRLMDIDTTVFAHELTMIEKAMFCSIELKEIMSGTWRKQNQPHLSPNVQRMKDFHSRLAGIIATEVVSQKEAVVRSEIIAKVIETADCCASFFNYQAVKTLLGTLQAFPVARLRKTWRKIPRKSKSLLRQLIVLSSGSQRAMYIRHKTACENSPNSLQYLGDVMIQMNYIEDVLYNDVMAKQSKSVHTKKLNELQDLLSSYKNAARGYCYERHPAVTKFLTRSATVNSVNDNLEMSRKREPDSEEKKLFY